MEARLKVLDMDAHLIPTHLENHADLLMKAAQRGLIVDVATSDVTIYLERPDGTQASHEDYDACFGGHWEDNRWIAVGS